MQKTINPLKTRVTISFSVSYYDWNKLRRQAIQSGKSLPVYLRELLKCEQLIKHNS